MRIHGIPIDPNQTLVLFALGVLLVYWEMCRPGMVVPGISGLTLAVLCAIKLSAAPRGSLNAWVAVPVGVALGIVTAVLGGLAVVSYLHKRSL